VNTYLKVARYHLVNRVQYTLLPLGWLAFAFAVCVVIFTIVDPSTKNGHVGALASIFFIFLALGVQSVVQLLPFGFALGLSRRTYYLGTVLLVTGLSVTYGLLITIMQEIERATGGWGGHLSFFRVPYILNGAWYLTWLTAFMGLLFFFLLGMWCGLIYRRWNLIGVFGFAATVITVALAGALSITWTHTWSGFDHFFRALSATGLTGMIAALALVLLTGGAGTMRRVTV
jgi:hypothetical protein